MKDSKFAAILLASLCTAAAAAAAPSGAYAVVEGSAGIVKARLFSPADESLAVATVGDDVVTLGELSQALSAVHQARTGAARPHGTDFRPALDRLIGSRLVLLEAREMGIDELPELRDVLKQFEESNLRALLQRSITRRAKADPAEVERRYRDAVRERRVRSALFPKEEDAKEAAAAVASGARFDDVVASAVAAKKAQGGTGVQVLSAKVQALPQIVAALEPLAPGGVAGPIQVERGWTLMQLQSVRYPRDAAARAEAERQALAARSARLLNDHYQQLLARSVKVDEALVKSLDFEAAEPGFEKLKQDARVLAAVAGEQPVTIADVCAALERVFFHGIPEAVRQKKVNARARAALDSLVSRRLVAVEARRRGLSSALEHRRAVEERRRELIFGFFVDKAVEPAVRISEADGLAWYEEHKRDYMLPGFYTLSSLGFETAAGAQEAMAKLKSGADLKWVRANASGQLPEAKLSVKFDGNTVTSKSMTPELTHALQGAQPRDLRLFSPAEGGHYLVVVHQVTAPEAQPYSELRSEILAKVRTAKVNQSLEEWIAKLRKARAVKVYIREIAI